MRILSGILGIVIILGVVFLGIRSGTDPQFVTWFGISAAIGSPVGLGLLAFAIRGRSNEKALEDLRKIPQIEQLINEAKSKEEQLRLLEEERSRLHEIIASESRRQTLKARRTAAETEAKRLLDEISTLDSQLERIDEEAPAQETTQYVRELRALVTARSNNDIVIPLASRTLILPKDAFFVIPFLGSFLYHYLRLLMYLSDLIRRDIKKVRKGA